MIESFLRTAYPRLLSYPAWLVRPLLALLRLITHESSIQAFIQLHESTPPLRFVDAILEHFNVSYTTIHSQLENIPSVGKVIIVANHPLGALDAMMLIQMVCSMRQDKKVKILANQFLSSITPLKPFLIGVDAMRDTLSKESLLAIDTALRAEEAVIIFPAGEVARATLWGVREGRWKAGVVRFAKRNSAPIVPIHVRGRNSWLFYVASWIYQPLGSILLAHEMFAARNRVYSCHIGAMINPKSLTESTLSDKQHAKWLRKHLHRIAQGRKGIYPTESAIAHPSPTQALRTELRQAEELGLTRDHKKIYLVEHDNAPTVIQEIGRLREYTFRKVGEGSGKTRDIDTYDRYYHHLVLWDDEALEIVGAYRIGESGWILPWLGQEGLYMHDLVHIDPSFEPILEHAIELGRSFVQPKYWGSRALDYLWQGIGAYLAHHPHIRYLYGPVSLSASYPHHAQAALVYFYTLYFKTQHTYVRARSPYLLSDYVAKEFEEYFVGDDYARDLQRLKEYLRPFNVTIPTLYKHYTELCEEGGVEFLDFGVDEQFNNCIDGYILVDLSHLKEEKRRRYLV